MVGMPRLAKTTITVRRATAAAYKFYLLNPGKKEVLPVLPLMVPLYLMNATHTSILSSADKLYVSWCVLTAE